MKLFTMGKNVKIKIFIWHMVGEMVKNGVGQGLTLIQLFCTLYFLVKLLLVKLKNLNPSTCLNLTNTLTSLIWSFFQLHNFIPLKKQSPRGVL